MADAPGVDELLAIARAEFAARLPRKVEDLAGKLADGAWADLRIGSHRLRGSAATYGFAALGTLAGAIEEILEASGGAPDADARRRVEVALAEARAEAKRAEGGAS